MMIRDNEIFIIVDAQTEWGVFVGTFFLCVDKAINLNFVHLSGFMCPLYRLFVMCALVFIGDTLGTWITMSLFAYNKHYCM